MEQAAERRAWIVLKAFLTLCEPEKREELEQFLPEKEREGLADLPSIGETISADRFSNWEILDKVHWSWFLPTLKSYSETEQKLFLSTLPPYAAKNLAKLLFLSSNGFETTPVARAFLRKTLLDSLLGPKEELLPMGYLPSSPLDRLLDLSKQELTRLIDFLSLHDLGAELRQIVETKILKKIYSLLSEEEKKFVKNKGGQKDPFSSGRLGLEKWDGSEESLRLLLHKRGLARFAAGLSGQNPDLIWYVCHQLDIGRGNALHKLCVKEPIHGVSDAIVRQIEELL